MKNPFFPWLAAPRPDGKIDENDRRELAGLVVRLVLVALTLDWLTADEITAVQSLIADALITRKELVADTVTRIPK